MVSTSYLKNFCSNDDVDDDGVIIFLWRIEEYVGVEISWHRFKFFYPSHLKLFASPPFRLKLVFSTFQLNRWWLNSGRFNIRLFAAGSGESLATSFICRSDINDDDDVDDEFVVDGRRQWRQRLYQLSHCRCRHRAAADLKQLRSHCQHFPLNVP